MSLFTRVCTAVIGLSGLVVFALTSPVAQARAASDGRLATDVSGQLPEKIEAALNTRYANAGITHRVTIRTPKAQWPVCADPKLTLPDNQRLTGNMSVAVQCERKQFIQVTVEAEGSYWVATQAIAAGSPVSREVIRPRHGPLSKLPANLVFSVQDIMGSVASRSISAGQPIVSAQLRKAWVIKIGDDVEVVLRGDGFRLRSKGRAMTNAALNAPLRVRMASGQVITGTINADGVVVIQP